MSAAARADPWSQPIIAGLIAACVGFGGSFAVVLKGLQAVGANEAQAASGLTALAIAMGLAGVILAVRSRMPISSAWSTPGAALLAATGGGAGGFPEAVGAFLIVGVLLAATGWFRPLARLVAAIPAAIASAMLAGILFGLCSAPVRAMASDPIPTGIVVTAWLVVLRWKRLYATPAAAVAAFAIIAWQGKGGGVSATDFIPHLTPIMPSYSWTATLGIAIPLFLVTMASQNLPGLAVLSAYGYKVEPREPIMLTGVFTILAAPFGGHAVNLSAIVAALCASPDASPDPTRRWAAAAANGVGCIGFGLFAGAVTHFVAESPLLIEAVAGLALLGAFGSALHNALALTDEREAALATFLTTSFGVTIWGIGGAFWGLVVGTAILIVTRAGAPSPPPAPRKA